MEKTFFVFCFLLAAVFSAEASDELFYEPPVYGIGVQKLGEGWGISGTAEINDSWAGQLVFGPFGNMHVYAVRGLYSFYRRMDWRVYAFGQGAYLEHRHDPALKRDNAMSFGAGLGVEFDWRRHFPELLPFFWNVELGVMTDKLEHKSVSGVRVGAGVHYRF
jgi:hypothetical protein